MARATAGDGAAFEVLVAAHRRELSAYAYVSHYNQQRPHRARELRPPSPIQPTPIDPASPIVRHPVLGGLINEYHRAA